MNAVYALLLQYLRHQNYFETFVSADNLDK